MAKRIEYHTGDRVRHTQTGAVATVTKVRTTFVNIAGRRRRLYTLDFGKSVKGSFGYEMNGGEFLAEALTAFNPKTIAPVTEADRSQSWHTDLTAEDFHKLQSSGVISDEDRDIIGRRFRHVLGSDNNTLEVFISEYAGDNRHALVYSYESLFDDVTAKVRSIEWLRAFYTENRGWQAVAA